jgi:cytochrome c-type biogenesis protein CcmH/NrfG
MFKAAFLSLCALMFFNPAWSADSTPTVAVETDLQKAQGLIAKKDWSGAVPVLESHVKANPRSADGFNLLGFSLRNLKKFDESLVAYKQALTVDPQHRGAHEYIGMAYVQMRQLDKAREHLASLDKICTFSCEEFRDLKKAIDQAAK